MPKTKEKTVGQSVIAGDHGSYMQGKVLKTVKFKAAKVASAVEKLAASIQLCPTGLTENVQTTGDTILKRSLKEQLRMTEKFVGATDRVRNKADKLRSILKAHLK